MAGGGLAVTDRGGGQEFETKITPIVIISCIMAATGGLMFGYDVGVSVVYRKTIQGDLGSNYCKYDNQGLQLFTSSLYLAGLTVTFFASYTTRRLRRRLTMLIAGVFFIIGVVFNAAAKNLAMLIVGRILLGCGAGFANQYRKTIQGDLGSNYCKYDNQGLQLFTSSLYLAGLTTTFVASYTTRHLGKRLTMLIAGVFFIIRVVFNAAAKILAMLIDGRILLGCGVGFTNQEFFIIGVVFNAAAKNLALLIVGRILLGCGVGFANQAVPVFLSEIAPTRIRGALNILFQLNVTIGILFANLVNYFTAKIEGGWGWRVSLGLAGIPALLLTVGALLVVDTPNSLIERGKLEEGKAVLIKIRGTENIEPEYFELVAASRIAKEVKHPFRNLLQILPTIYWNKRYHVLCPGIYSVDKLGRRFLLLQAGVQMFCAQLVIAVILGFKVTDTSENLNSGFAMLVVIMICTFVSAFAWSWGPLGWLIPSETFPLETRSAGQSITVCINLVFTFIIAQQPLMKPLVTRGFTTVGIEELTANDGTSCNSDTDETSCCKRVHTPLGVEELPPLLYIITSGLL
nr:sugar transport protein 13 [Tanacetum cinerariifolium]